MRLETLNQLRTLFVGISHDEAPLGSLQLSQSQLRELAYVARIRIAKGVARPSELIRLEAELEKFNAEVEKARALAGIHCDQLNLWLGVKLPDNFRVDIDL